MMESEEFGIGTFLLFQVVGCGAMGLTLFFLAPRIGLFFAALAAFAVEVVVLLGVSAIMLWLESGEWRG